VRKKCRPVEVVRAPCPCSAPAGHHRLGTPTASSWVGRPRPTYLLSPRRRLGSMAHRDPPLKRRAAIGRPCGTGENGRTVCDAHAPSDHACLPPEALPPDPRGLPLFASSMVTTAGRAPRVATPTPGSRDATSSCYHAIGPSLCPRRRGAKDSGRLGDGVLKSTAKRDQTIPTRKTDISEASPKSGPSVPAFRRWLKCFNRGAAKHLYGMASRDYRTARLSSTAVCAEATFRWDDVARVRPLPSTHAR
jgi:hypothetical protein